jgi:hypothetical protein
MINRFVEAICPPEIGVASGIEISRKIRNAKHKLTIHSLDYDNYLVANTAKRDVDINQGVVFLHQAPEYSSEGTHRDMSAVYCVKMVDMLTKLSTATGLPIIIALHPRARTHHISPFSNFTIVDSDTAKLVKNAKLVVNHCSTAVSYPVLWRKPILHVTEYSFKILAGDISILARKLNTTYIDLDLDNVLLPSIDQLFTVDMNAYSEYERQYIKPDRTCSGLFWPELLQKLTISEKFGALLRKDR